MKHKHKVKHSRRLSENKDNIKMNNGKKDILIRNHAGQKIMK